MDVRNKLGADNADFDFLAHVSSGFGVLKAKTCRADNAGIIAEGGLYDLDTAFRNLGCTGNLLAHCRGKEVEVVLAYPAAQNDTARQQCVDQGPRGGGRGDHRALDDGPSFRIIRPGGKYGTAIFETQRL